MRQFIATTLADRYTILQAADGQQGLQAAQEAIPDIIVCDIMMPVMDGLECCRQLKADQRTCHIPVILLTACTLDQQRATGYNAGADSYLPKPFDTELLAARLSNLLAARKRLTEYFSERTLIKKTNISQPEQDFITRFRDIIARRLRDPDTTVDTLAADMALSRVQLYRKVKALAGVAPTDILRDARLERAQTLLQTTRRTVAEVAYDCGFSTPSYFTKCYKEKYGHTPSSISN